MIKGTFKRDAAGKIVSYEISGHAHAGEYQYPFEIDETWKHKLVNGLDEIGITLNELAAIEAYEQKIPAYWR